LTDSDSAHTDSPDAEARPSALRRWGRRAAWTVGIAVGALLLLIGAVLLVLQTETGATTTVQWLAASANPLPNTQLTVDRASGSWVRSLRLTGVQLTRTDSTGTSIAMARVDTLAARYNLLALLQGRLHVERLSVAGPAVTMRQAPDSTWDWLRVLPTAEPADTSAGMPIRLDSLRLARGAVTASFYADGRDSTARIRNLQLRVHDLQSASDLSATLDTLGLRGRLPGDTTNLRLAARGALSPTTAVLDTLHLDSPRSRVRGRGTVRLPTAPDEAVDDVSFALRATPFALRDLRLLAPTLDVDPNETVQIDVRGEGSGQRLTTTAEVRFSGGGTVTATADVTPTAATTPEGPPLHYRLNADVRALTTSLLGPPDTSQNRLSAALAVDLQGRSLSTLNGTADLQLTNTRWANLHVPTLTFASTLRDGTASLDLQGTLNEARLRATGQATPLAEAPSLDATAHLQHVDMAAFAPDAGVDTDLAATTDIQAEGLGTTRQAVDLTMALDSSRIGTQRIDAGTVSLAVQPERAQFSGNLILPLGNVEASGFAALDGSERFALTTAHLTRFNAAALVGDTTANRLTGTAEISGQGFTPETMQLDATLTLRDSFYGPYQLSSFSTTATLNRGRLKTSTDATLNGGSWTLAVAGAPFAPRPTFKLTQGRFRDVDIGAFSADTTQSSDLQGAMRGTIQGIDPTTMRVDAGLTLDTSRVNQQRINEAALTLGLRSGQFDTTVRLDTPEGGLQMTARARPFDDVPTFQVTEGSFDTLDAGSLGGLPDLTTALSGTFSLNGRGATASTLSLDADLSLAESRINDATLSQGRLAVATEMGRATVDGQFAIAGGTIQLTGTADSLAATPTADSLAATPTYGLQTTVRSLNAAALAGTDSLTARIDSLQWRLDGRGTTPSTMTATTDLAARRVQVDQLTLDSVDLAGRLHQGQLVLDTLRMQSNVAESRGSGTLALTDPAATSDFSLRTEITNARPLRRLVGAAKTFQIRSGTIETNVYGSSLANQRFDGTVALNGLAYDDMRLTEAELTFNGRRGREQWLQQFELSGTLGYLSLPSFSVEQTSLHATSPNGSALDLSTQVRFTPSHTADLTATVEPDVDKTEVTLTQVNLRLDKDRWSLLKPTTISISDHYRVRGLSLHSGPQQIVADGVVDPTGTQNLLITVEALELGPIAPFVGLSGGVGTLNGTVDLTGPAAAPVLTSQLAVDLRTKNRSVGTLRLATQYRDLTLDLDATLTHTSGRTLTAEGSIPTDLRLQASTPVDIANQPVRIDLATEEFPLDWLNPFLDPATVQDVRGRLAADVQVRGTLNAPDLSGTAALADGGATLTALNTRYRNGTGTLRFTDNRIVRTTASC